MKPHYFNIAINYLYYKMSKLYRAHNNYNGISKGHECTNPNRFDFFFFK